MKTLSLSIQSNLGKTKSLCSGRLHANPIGSFHSYSIFDSQIQSYYNFVWFSRLVWQRDIWKTTRFTAYIKHSDIINCVQKIVIFISTMWWVCALIDCVPNSITLQQRLLAKWLHENLWWFEHTFWWPSFFVYFYYHSKYFRFVGRWFDWTVGSLFCWIFPNNSSSLHLERWYFGIYLLVVRTNAWFAWLLFIANMFGKWLKIAAIEMPNQINLIARAFLFDMIW